MTKTTTMRARAVLLPGTVRSSFAAGSIPITLRGSASRLWSATRSSLPAVVGPAPPDEPSHGYDHPGECEPKVDDSIHPLGTPHQLLVRVGPRIGAFDGLLANDKFCMSRHARLSLGHSRRPNLRRRRTDWATDARAYPPAGITRHGGDDETVVAPTAGNSETPGREATLGPGVPGHPAVEPGKRADSRSGRERQGGVP